MAIATASPSAADPKTHPLPCPDRDGVHLLPAINAPKPRPATSWRLLPALVVLIFGSAVQSVSTSQRLVHILVCVNRRENSELPCCADAGAEAVYQTLHQWVAQRQMLAKIWVSRTACLGWCNARGTTVVFYPDDKWYRAVTVDDCPTLIDRHLRPLCP